VSNSSTTSTLSARRSRKGFTHESSKSATVEWYTPGWVFDSLGLTFDLDVCSPGAGKTCVPALRHYTPVEDGLTSPWYGTVWCNPPYGRRSTGVWLEKLMAHGDGVALVFARPDTVWFQEAMKHADVVCFVERRIRFIDGRTGLVSEGSPGAGSALIAFGQKAAHAVLQSGIGVCVQSVSTDATDAAAPTT
jgi:phage N-6-adenine-methyltransferase